MKNFDLPVSFDELQPMKWEKEISKQLDKKKTKTFKRGGETKPKK